MWTRTSRLVLPLVFVLFGAGVAPAALFYVVRAKYKADNGQLVTESRWQFVDSFMDIPGERPSAKDQAHERAAIERSKKGVIDVAVFREYDHGPTAGASAGDNSAEASSVSERAQNLYQDAHDQGEGLREDEQALQRRNEVLQRAKDRADGRLESIIADTRAGKDTTAAQEQYKRDLSRFETERKKFEEDAKQFDAKVLRLRATQDRFAEIRRQEIVALRDLKEKERAKAARIAATQEPAGDTSKPRNVFEGKRLDNTRWVRRYQTGVDDVEVSFYLKDDSTLECYRAHCVWGRGTTTAEDFTARRQIDGRGTWMVDGSTIVFEYQDVEKKYPPVKLVATVVNNRMVVKHPRDTENKYAETYSQGQ